MIHCMRLHCVMADNAARLLLAASSVHSMVPLRLAAETLFVPNQRKCSSPWILVTPLRVLPLLLLIIYSLIGLFFSYKYILKARLPSVMLELIHRQHGIFYFEDVSGSCPPYCCVDRSLLFFPRSCWRSPDGSRCTHMHLNGNASAGAPLSNALAWIRPSAANRNQIVSGFDGSFHDDTADFPSRGWELSPSGICVKISQQSRWAGCAADAKPRGDRL